MFIEQKYRIQVRDTRKGTEATNKAFLGLMEDVGSVHSTKVGFGVYDIPKTHLTWLLLDWKLKVISRPNYENMVYVKTWSRGIEKYYAYRDFEVHDEQGNLLAVATSKWVLVNAEKHKVVKVEDYVAEAYETEIGYDVFDDEKLGKLKEPESYSDVLEYKIARRDIDLYNHVHNLYYLDLAYEVLPDDVYSLDEFNNVRISYKREIKFGEEIKCMYKQENGKHIVAIKSKDEKVLHSIIEMW